MRIQHNIPALNANRNLTNNNNALAKNLQKLSSGYRINGAADDASGLAVSEKMRSQMTGLETAQKNAQDGISLVQTAEGALTEVHSMLNRMVELATQSANGIYTEDDRIKMNDEVNELKKEIDRISDSTTFNGINLLDGSIAKGDAVEGVITDFEGTTTEITETSGTAYEAKITITTDPGAGDSATFEVTYKDESGAVQSATFSVDPATAGADLTANSAAEDLQKQLSDHFGDAYDVTVNGADITVKARDVGKGKIEIIDVKGQTGTQDAADQTIATTAATDTTFNVDAGTDIVLGEDNYITVDGKKFQILSKGEEVTDGYTGIFVDQTAGSASADSVEQIVKQLQEQGVAVEVSATTATTLEFLKEGESGATGGTLELQVGDTSDSFQRVGVNIDDMSSAALGIQGVDLTTAEGSRFAIDTVNEAINRVSATRANLGAVQNRLENTINSLGVSIENTTAAESRIRDVDMAKEMMDYSKNNILVQSAQAMLAQANQAPQGVLQLLQ